MNTITRIAIGTILGASAIIAVGTLAFSQETAVVCPVGKPYCEARPVVSPAQGREIDNAPEIVYYNRAAEAAKPKQHHDSNAENLCPPPYRMGPDGCQLYR